MDNELTTGYIVKRKQNPIAEVLRKILSTEDPAKYGPHLYVPSTLIIGGMHEYKGAYSLGSEHLTYFDDATTLGAFAGRMRIGTLRVDKVIQLDADDLQVLRKASDSVKLRREVSDFLQSV